MRSVSCKKSKVDNSYRELAFYKIATMTETPFMTENLATEADQTAVTDTAADIAARFGIEDFSGIAQQLEKKDPQERTRWALETFTDRIVLTSSFGAQSAVMLHLATRERPDIPVILVDTGYLFAETYHFIDELTDSLDLNLQVFRSEHSPAWLEARHGKLWENGVEGIEQYNQIHKVEPMERAFAELDAVAAISGIRRQQSSSRAELPVVAIQKGRVKIHPVIDWTDMQVGRYLTDNGLPYHPLWEKGYVSIGDWHTTKKLTDGMSEEDTRFFGLKRECGLNEELDFVI